MKTAIYIQEGLTQFVLTPETEIDRKVLQQLESGQELQTFRGAFYNCQGGWMRQEDGDGYEQFSYGREPKRDSSLIFVMRPKSAVKEV